MISRNQSVVRCRGHEGTFKSATESKRVFASSLVVSNLFSFLRGARFVTDLFTQQHLQEILSVRILASSSPCSKCECKKQPCASPNSCQGQPLVVLVLPLDESEEQKPHPLHSVPAFSKKQHFCVKQPASLLQASALRLLPRSFSQWRKRKRWKLCWCAIISILSFRVSTTQMEWDGTRCRYRQLDLSFHQLMHL